MTKKKLRPEEQPSKPAPDMGELEAVLVLVAGTMERSPLELEAAAPVLDDATALELLGRLRRAKSCSRCGAAAPTVADLERARAVLRSVALELLTGQDAGLAPMAHAAQGIATREGCYATVAFAARFAEQRYQAGDPIETVAYLLDAMARPAVERIAQLDRRSGGLAALESDTFASDLEALLSKQGAATKIELWLTSRTEAAVYSARTRARRGVNST